VALIDKIKNKDFELCWGRGDDDAKVFTIRDDKNVALDISTWTLSMAVNTLKDPPDVTTEVFTIGGIFVTDGTDGQVSFTPPSTSLDNVKAPSTAFYGIQRITPTKKTLIKGKVVFVMDIDKG